MTAFFIPPMKKTIHKTELLAPAGSFDALKGAINAGADAVYLGGVKFGARAYASNFTEEELLEGLKYAHIFNKKIYLTLNTLVKEKEFFDIYDFLSPYYEAGLDGIIIQDIGVMDYVHEKFPDLPIHVSTQAFVTGPFGAEYFKKLGAVRVVPARELSLEEIKAIKDTGVEVETFIHGAMCYSYSGQCLFSGIVGGRSGNRGRCAGPCRLPYGFKQNNKDLIKGEKYPLSLKDMCTVYDLYSLMDAGIDSFKIEGRMKKPEYVAGVVSVYRKYMDLYYDNPGLKPKVSAEDDKLLRNLYIRSEIQSGYYFKHNGKDMITIDSPAYTATKDSLLDDIRDKYLKDVLKAPVKMECNCEVNKPLELRLAFGELEAYVKSDSLIEASINHPTAKEDIVKNLSKLGNTYFYSDGITVNLKGDCFVPVKLINELRRQAVEAICERLTDAILLQRKNRIYHDERG